MEEKGWEKLIADLSKVEQGQSSQKASEDEVDAFLEMMEKQEERRARAQQDFRKKQGAATDCIIQQL